MHNACIYVRNKYIVKQKWQKQIKLFNASVCAVQVFASSAS